MALRGDWMKKGVETLLLHWRAGEDMFGGGKRECGEKEKRVRSGKEGFLRKEE